MTTPSKVTPGPPPLVLGLSALAERYDLVLSDVWGVIHDGRQHFPAAVSALARFRAKGGTVVLITNAPRPRRPIMRQLDHLAVPHSAYDSVVTSGDVTLALMAAHGNAPVHHIGPERDLALFDILRENFKLVPPRVPLSKAAYVLCSGLNDDRTETPDDYDRALADMRARHLAMICANPDIVVHSGEHLIYCAGALAQRLESQGGMVTYAGKPYEPIYDMALREAEMKRSRPIERGRVLAIGDAFHTDMAGAALVGVDALFVTGGIHRDELHGPDGAFDAAAFRRLLADHAALPTAAIHRLVW